MKTPVQRIMKFAGMAALLIAFALPFSGQPLAAQTGQSFSIQLSGLGSAPFGGGLASMSLGPGGEVQLRYSPSAFSVGVGVDATFHSVDGTETDVTLAGGFIEPRYVIFVGSETVAPYISARGAVSQTEVQTEEGTATATGYTLNGGGGLLFVLNSRTNIDVGATLGFKDVGIAEFPSGTFDLGTGANLILRLGIAFGLGG